MMLKLRHSKVLFVWAALMLSIATTTAILNEECGMRPVPEHYGRVRRVAHGRDAHIGAWPWVARVQRQTGEIVCTMALINPQWAVTSGDCMTHSPYIHRHVYEGLVGIFGEVNTETSSDSVQKIPIDKAFVHPDYNGFFSTSDIALVHLADPVNITDYVRPVCLSNSINETLDYETCWLAGWGYLNVHNEDPTHLQESRAMLKDRSECAEHDNGYYLEDDQICAFETNPCGGDGGAPLACLGEDNLWYTVGLFSFYIGECGDQFSVYTKISSYMDFIEETIQNFEECNSPYRICDDGETCVLDNEICDGTEDCPSGDDELNCPQELCNDTTCANGAECTDLEDDFYCNCTSGWTGRRCDQVACGDGFISLSPGQTANISSPGYPNNYLDDAACVWYIDAMEGNKILVEFEDLQLERGYDFLEIDGTTYTGNDYPDNLHTSSNETVIKFLSNPYTSYKGFRLNISAIDVTGLDECQWNPCENNGTCTDMEDGYTCECLDGWLEPNCHTADYCGPEEIVLEPGSSYSLTSFNFPGSNPDRLFYSCKWTVKAPGDHKIQVDFVNNTLYKGFDSLFFGEESVVENTSPFLSEEDSMDIIFYNSGFAMGFNLTLSDYLPPDGQECDSNPCQNAGYCSEKKNGFTCKCRRAFTGKLCEKGVPCSRENYVRCNNGRCINAVNVCDGRNDCRDYSDEVNCDCEKWCHVGRCLPERLFCDSKKNCGDGSDEIRPMCSPLNSEP